MQAREMLGLSGTINYCNYGGVYLYMYICEPGNNKVLINCLGQY